MNQDLRSADLVLANGIFVEVIGTGRGSNLGTTEDELVGGLTAKVDSAAVDLAGTISRFCQSIQESVDQLGVSEVCVEFGVGVKAGVNLPFITGGSSEGTVRVTATWTRPPTLNVLLRQAIVCIKDASGVVVGTGVLISPDHLLTCAPVAAKSVDLKCVFFGREGDARDVIAISKAPDRLGYLSDVAILTLTLPAPFNAGERVLPWHAGRTRTGDTVHFAGYLQDLKNATNPDIVRTLVGLNDTDRGCFALQDGCTRGFSGGPVVSGKESLAVTGLVVANLSHSPQRTWFLPYQAVNQAVVDMGFALPPAQAG